MNNINDIQNMLSNARNIKNKIANLPHALRVSALLGMAKSLLESKDKILLANKIDMDNAQNLSESLRDRLLLNPNRITLMAKAIEEIAALKDPLGKTLEGWNAPSGINIQKVSVPIGVIGAIYESRPNVTSDIAAMCLKSGNVIVLKGGKEAYNSNHAILDALQNALKKAGIAHNAINLIQSVERSATLEFIQSDEFIDLLIPRGSEELIKYVSSNSSIPIIKHDKGVCHLYVEKSADLNMALDITLNAKISRPSACNAIETLLIDEFISKDFLPLLKKECDKMDTKIKGDENVAKIIPCEHLVEDDYKKEYGDKILNVKIVKDSVQAIEHINAYGSSHSDSIITQNHEMAERFLEEVDSACVYVNASTRFSDGGEFGFGAEVGISTARLHARGPMGIDTLTTYKYKIYGHGEIRK